MTTERPLAEDTPLAVERLQIEIWRRMTPAEKFAQLVDLNASLILFANAGIRLRHPGATEREVFLRRAALTLDRQTMIAAYDWDPELRR